MSKPASAKASTTTLNRRHNAWVTSTPFLNQVSASGAKTPLATFASERST
jgi:hypothetical protein